jgi:hypothetical protein
VILVLVIGLILFGAFLIATGDWCENEELAQAGEGLVGVAVIVAFIKGLWML